MLKEQPHRDGTVNLVGDIPELLSLRVQILQGAGYTVFTTTHPEEAEFRMGDGNCGILLLCYSVAPDWRDRLLKHFREHCPNGWVVGITNHPVAESPKDVDALVYGIEGPEALLDAIRRKVA